MRPGTKRPATGAKRQAHLGVFDSGVGGLTVVRELRRALPQAKISYFGDTARVPYGTKSKPTILAYTTQVINFLVSRGVGELVAACNTASALAVPSLRGKLKLKLSDVVAPACRGILEEKNPGPVWVLGTSSTIASHIYRKTLKRMAPGLKVREIACPLFVPLVEEGLSKGPLVTGAIAKYLPKGRRPGAVLLGCTHYPLLKSALAKALGRGTPVVDSAWRTAQEIGRGHGLPKAGKGTLHCFVSDDPEGFRLQARRLAGLRPDSVRRVAIESYSHKLGRALR